MPRVTDGGIAAVLALLAFGSGGSAGSAGPAGATASAGARIRFVVVAPTATPAGSVLWLSGDIAPLGGWNGAGLRLEPRGERTYMATLELPPRTVFEYKVTRGSWDTVEKGAAGEEIANRRFTAVADDSVRLVVASWRDQTEAGSRPRRSTRTGDVRVHGALPSRFVRARDVLVWLPPGYAADTIRRYPVLYFHDGNNLFDDSTSFAGEWRLDETAARLISTRSVPPFIAVGVANTPDRMTEYTPVADPHHGGGRAGDYARFLIEELKPFIDRAYRTRPVAASTGIAGSSLGGLVSLSIAFDHPDVFGLVGAVSPSVWWADGWIAGRAARAPRSLRVWLDIGTAEGSADAPASLVDGVKALRDSLLAAGLEPDAVHFEAVEGARHNEAAWSARLDRVLEFLLGATAGSPQPGRPREAALPRPRRPR